MKHAIFPPDTDQATLIARVWMPGTGPVLALATPDALYDLSALALTCADLIAMDQPAALVAARRSALPQLADMASVLANTPSKVRDASQPYLLAPCDLQPIKAAGVTFVASMLERVIEEQARGDAARAQSVRQSIAGIIGDNLRAVVPGSEQAAQVKAVLVKQGLWSQYLEVGIGPDAEVFTKSQAMSAVGWGSDIGIHPKSEWNNPEPEIVLTVSPKGVIQGIALGNDVNLRDFEGRSALLLGKAKDNNASCAIGPFIRLFDEHYTLDHARQTVINLHVKGEEGFELKGASSMNQISRDPQDLVHQTLNANHQYPDGFMLFCGTMFAPTQDRFGPGQGFTHAVGDVVTIASEALGSLTNTVQHCDQITPWTYGLRALMQDLARR
jgi:fumarylacetoacetate (FAA) hydrolase family protein